MKKLMLLAVMCALMMAAPMAFATDMHGTAPPGNYVELTAASSAPAADTMALAASTNTKYGKLSMADAFGKAPPGMLAVSDTKKFYVYETPDKAVIAQMNITAVTQQKSFKILANTAGPPNIYADIGGISGKFTGAKPLLADLTMSPSRNFGLHFDIRGAPDVAYSVNPAAPAPS